MRVDPSDEVPTWSADWLDFFDCIAEGILMPLGALLMSIMYGWELGPEVVHAEATCEGQKFGAYGWVQDLHQVHYPPGHAAGAVRPDQGVLLLSNTYS